MAIVGYIRVSTVDQNTCRQLDAISLDKVFEDKVSGANTNRPQLQAMLDYVRSGDKVMIHSIDRLARNTSDLQNIVNFLKDKDVTVKFVKENLEFTANNSNPINDLMFNLLGSFAQFERALILERQREGIEKAKQAGKYKGRPATIDAGAIRKARAEGKSFRAIAMKLGHSLSTVQRVLKD